MLGKHLRALLLEHKDWEKALAAKEDSNPSQTWGRTKREFVADFADLRTMAVTIDEKKQAELFNKDNLEPLLKTILGFQGQNYTIMKDDRRRMILASMMADISLEYCSILYRLLEPVEEFAKLNLNMIEQTRALVRILHLKATTELKGHARQSDHFSIDVKPRRKKGKKGRHKSRGKG